MICKNCGKEIADNSRFCTLCGAKQEEQGTPAVETPVQSEVPVQNVAPAQNEVPAQNVPPVQNEVPVQSEAPVSGNVPPQGTATFDNTTPAQTVVDPVGQPAGVPFQPIAQGGKKFDFKKYLPMIIGIAVAVVVVVIAVVAVVKIVSNSGVNGVVSRMEDAINDKDSEKLKECYPDFVSEEMDVDTDSIDSALGLMDGFDVDVDFEVVDEEDITDEDYDYDDTMTWAEYIQENYADNYVDYDDEDIDAVKKVTVKMSFDFDNSIADYLADSLSSSEQEQELTCVKVDGDWYIFD